MNKNALKVKSLFKEYEALFEVNHENIIKELFTNKKFHVIIDNKVKDLHFDRLKWISNAATTIGVDAIEKNKGFDSVKMICKTLLDNNINKNDVIIVIGGGIIQDLSAFASNILKRGIDWYYFPTTLLAMCDSCIGSKVGINMSGYKNQLGIFWPPNKVLIDIDFLSTLPKDDIISGIGEIIKVHLISSKEDFDELQNKYEIILNDFEQLKPFIYKSLEIKKSIVEIDEFDTYKRHILNYGHTFGHAIEAYTNNLIPHGIGVTIGIDIANYISLQKGYIQEKEYLNISNTVRKNIPYKALDYSNHDLLSKYLKADKKFDGRKLKVILCKGAGNIFIDEVEVDEKLCGWIGEYANIYTKSRF